MAKIEKKVAKVAQKPENRLQRYFRETRGELGKVTWPTREEATNLTIIVLIVIAVMSVFLGILDLVFSRFLGLVFGL